MDIAPSHAGRAWLIPILEELRPLFKETAALSFFVNVLGLAAPVFVLQVYDRVVFHAGLSTLAGLALGMVFAVGFDFLLRQARAHIMQRVALKIDITVSRSLFAKIMALPLQTLESRPTSYWQLLFRDVEVVRNTLSGATALLAVDLPFAVLFIGLIFVIAWPVAWVLVVILLCFMTLAWRSGGVVGSAADKEKGTAVARDAFLAEIIAGRTAVKALAMSNHIEEQWERRQFNTIAHSMKRGEQADTFVNMGMLLTVIATVSMTTVGALAIIDQAMTIGSLIAANMLAGRLLSPMNQLVGAWRAYAGFKQSINRLAEVFGQAEDLRQSPVAMPRPRGQLTLEQVQFAYGPKSPPVIAGVSLKFSCTGITAVMGMNGSGKTTLIKLLLGLYRPVHGRVLLDDADLAQFSRNDVANWVGYVPQDCVLLNGTIRENICHARPTASDADIIRAATLAQAHKLIVDLPQGYATPVGEGGGRLSGGMRQRVSIARALLGDPPIVIMDEPTSSLDRQAEEDLARTLLDLAKDRPVIVVTHSPVLLQVCSNLIVMEAGKIAIQGPPRDVWEEMNRRRRAPSPQVGVPASAPIGTPT
ncbi:MAG: ATP-binding cassette domain-containing protein [Rhodospirillaceae bacterium]|nr:MAG: ATP-binding cassette domain-containing protein [Rhodospirillaceae bacterium]